jgi:hypothetical protein
VSLFNVGKKGYGPITNCKKGYGPITNCNDDVVLEIFKHCDAITLFRCSSIMKRWKKLIFETNFLQKRYEREKQRPLIYCRGELVFKVPTHGRLLPDFKVLTFDVETLKRHFITDFTSSDELTYKADSCFRVHSSCNGVLLISYNGRLFVCNPIIRHWTRFFYSYTAYDSKMLCLYHHWETDSFHILIREDYGRKHFSTSVGEFGPGMTELLVCVIGEESFDKTVDPAPIQIGDNVYWVPMLYDAVSISVFDTISETMSSIPVPPLTEKKIYWTTLLELNENLAASIAWGNGETLTLTGGPTFVDL